MKEYTVFSALSVAWVVFIDRQSGVRVLGRGEFYIFLLAMLLLKFCVNGYLTGTEIVLYNPKFYLGVRIASIPVEDFFFGFSLVTLSVILWEYFKART